MSASKPSASSRSSPSEKSMRRKRVSQATSRAKASKRSSAAGIAVDAHERAGRPDPAGHEPRVAAVAERAVDGGVPRLRIEQVDQLTGEDRDVRARHVKKDGQGSQRFRTTSALSACWSSLQRSRSQISRWSRLPTTTTSFWIPACSQQRLVQRDPAGRVELGVERAAREVAGELAALGADRVQVRQEASRSSARRRPGAQTRRRARAPWPERLLTRRRPGTSPGR